MKVLMISTDRNILNTESEVYKRMQEYAKLVDQLHIIIFIEGKNETKHQENLFLYPTNSPTRWLYILNAIQIARAIKEFDIVTTQDPFETGLAGWLIARKNNTPLQVQIHTDFLNHYFTYGSFLNCVRVLIAKYILPQADGIRVVSRRIKESLDKGNIKLKTEPAVLPIFVDTEYFENASIKQDLHKKYPRFDFIILMASRLTKEKNIPLAIHAFKEIVKKYPSMGLVIAGSGPEEKKLKIESSNINTNIVFESWTDDPASLYKSADLFLLTSDYEGYARSVVEASAAGLPVIMTDVGTAGELIQDGVNGLIIPIGDVQALITAIESIKEGKASLQRDIQTQTKEEYAKKQKVLWENCVSRQESFKKE